MKSFWLKNVSFWLIACLWVNFAIAQTLTGAGASSPFPIYAKWAQEYAKQTGIRVNYQSIGSGGGQQQIMAGTVDFGASDTPMSAKKIQDHHLFQFPAVVGGIVPVVNLPGVAEGELVLSGDVLADIFLGKIRKWNDPAITTLNPHLSLPDRSIIVVHRSDGSGTTYVFTDYLAKVSPAWRSRIGVSKAVKWPTGQGGKGNEGIAAYVRLLKHTIGYVEYAYAKQSHLTTVSLINASGEPVAPKPDTFRNAVAQADWLSDENMGIGLNNIQGEQVWPIVSPTFILVSKDRLQESQATLAFYNWSWRYGADLAQSLGYVPLPDNVINLIHAQWQLKTQTHR